MSELEGGVAYVAIDGAEVIQISELKRISMVSDVIIAARKSTRKLDLNCMWVGGALVDPNDEFAPFYTCSDDMIVVLSSKHTEAPKEDPKWKGQIEAFRKSKAQ